MQNSDNCLPLDNLSLFATVGCNDSNDSGQRRHWTSQDLSESDKLKFSSEETSRKFFDPHKLFFSLSVSNLNFENKKGAQNFLTN